MLPLTAGVADAGLALPRTRVETRHGLVAAAWHDEDVITLSVRAALPLVERAGTAPAALLLASVSSPFAEGGAAQVIAEALGITGDLHVAEHGGTVAAAGSAVAAAAGLLAAGIRPVLLVAADTRRDAGGHALGDGALALLLTERGEGGGGELALLGSRTELFRDRWRRDGERTLTAAERSLRRWSPAAAAAGAFPAGDAGAPVLAGPDGPGIERAGALGCPGVLAMALLALAGLEPGATLRAAVSAGGVTHALAASAGPRSAALAARLRAEIDGGAVGPWPPAPEGDFDPYASEPRSWRERGQDLRLEAQRDPATGEVLYPPVPEVAAGGLVPHRLGRRGTVLAVTRDHVFPYGGPLTMAVVALDGGGRFYGQVTDGRDARIGEPVRLTLRRLHDGGGLPHYFWKVEPAGVERPGAGAVTDEEG